MRQKQPIHTFYLLLLTQAISVLGSTMTAIAIGIWVFQRTGQATPLTLIALLAVLPRTLLGSVAGALVDRWDRRAVLLLADLGQVLGTILLCLSLLSNAFQIWHLYVVAVLQSGFAVFHEPAFQASTTLLVADRHRDRANALQQLTSPATGILAPTVAGWLYVVVGIPGIVAIDLCTFACAILVLWFVRIPRPTQRNGSRPRRTSILHDVRIGFRFVHSRRGLFWMLILLGLVNVVFLSTYRLYIPYILLRTGDPALLGTILGVMNIGGLGGGLLMSAWGGTRRRMYTLLPAMFASGLMLAAVGVSRSAAALGISLFGIMLFPPFIHAPLTALIQRTVPAELQGRTFALVGVFAQLLTPIAYAGVGPLVDRVLEPTVRQPGWAYVAPLVGDTAGAGIGLLMVIGGSLVVGITLVFAAVPAIRSLESTTP